MFPHLGKFFHTLSMIRLDHSDWLRAVEPGSGLEAGIILCGVSHQGGGATSLALRIGKKPSSGTRIYSPVPGLRVESAPSISGL